MTKPIEETCKKCNKPLLHGRHVRGERCLDLSSIFTRPQNVVHENDRAITTRPEGIEPGKLEVVWRKRRD